MSKTLVAYFSASGVTGSVARTLSDALNADLYEITPAIRYTDEDLDWRNANSRSSLEMKDKASRPEIIDAPVNIADYDTILVGFPIWWYVAPTIVNTFLEKHDFADKRIILFATSGGSRFGRTVDSLKDSVPGAVIEEGMLQRGKQDMDAWTSWAKGLWGNNMKKIIAINGSPRSGWNTDILVREAAAGAASAGAEVEVIDLYKLEKFTGCVSCFGCKTVGHLGQCVCRDGLHDVLEKIRHADGLILGSPVYLGDISAGLRALYERLVFQYITYKTEVRSYNERKIPVVLIVTSNVPAEYDTELLSRYKGTLEAFIGPTQTLASGSTLQVNNYERYNWTMFNAEEKKARRETVFPEERKEAYQLGADMLRL